MERATRQNKRKPLLAVDARALILRLIDPADPQSLDPHRLDEERLQLLLYTLKTIGFNASGLKCTAQHGRFALSSQIKNAVYAIAIREGDASEMFCLGKKIKGSIVQEEDVDKQAAEAVKQLSKMSAGRVFDTITWEESYPEPMKSKDLLAEIKSIPQDHTDTINNLKVIAQTWKLQHDTPTVQVSRSRPRL